MANSFYTRIRACLIGILYGLAVVIGLRAALVRDRQPIDLLLSFSLSAVTTLACVNDARSLQKNILYSVQFIMLFTWPLSPLVYMVWARKARGLFWFLIHAALLAFTYLVSVYATAFLVHLRK